MGRRQLPVGTTRRFNPDRLERDLHRRRARESGEPDSVISKIVWRHVRLQANGRPIRCQASAREVDLTKLHSSGKVVFDSLADARRCVRELRELTGEEIPMYVYPCNRSRRGHMHMTRDPRSGGKKI